MTKYFTQWESDTIGATEAGWTQLGGATTAHVPAYAAAGVNPVKRRYSALTPGGAGTFELLQYDACNADANRANFDICTLVIGALCTATTVRVAYARGQGSGTVTDYYAVSIVLATGVISLLKRVASANSSVATATDATTCTPTSAFFVRFRGNGTTLQVRVWLASLGMAGEPTTWAINTTDASLSAAGWIARGGFGSGLVTALAFFSVGTNGDSAVCPRTNAEVATAAASKSFKPNVLGDLAFTGYDSGGAPYTKTIYGYVATRTITTAEQDTPSRKTYRNYIKKAPTISRQMGADLAGPVSTGFGNLVLTNPRSTARGPGVLDDWLRLRPIRSAVTLYLGDERWPKHDYRVVLVGRLGEPVATSVSEITFDVRDFSDFLDVDIQTSLFTSGDYIDQRKPIFWGQMGGDASHGVGQIEPPLTDSVNLIYTISDASVQPWSPATSAPSCLVRDNQVEIRTALLTNTSVSGNELTFSANHGMVVNYMLQTPLTGALPGGLTNGTNYWVQSVSALNKCTLSATRGGAVQVLTTTTPIANTFRGYGYTIVNTGPSTIQLAAAPVGRITVSDVISSAAGLTTFDIASDICTRAGLSANYGPTYGAAAGFTFDMAYWQGTQKRSARDVLNDIMAGSLGWYAFTLDGLLVTDAVSLPLSTSVKSFVEGDVNAGPDGKQSTLRQTGRIRAKDMTKAQVSVKPWFVTAGPFQTGAQAALQLKSFRTVSSYGAASTPLDNYPTSTDSDKRFVADYYATNSAPDYTALYKLPIGIYEFETHLGGLFTSTGPLSIGDTISLTHSRMGWKSFGAGTVSPDNASAFDATKAVVCGIETNLKDMVKLRVYRQIPGYYPTTDLN